MEQKAVIRAQAIKAREGMPYETAVKKSRSIAGRLLSMEAYRQADTLYLYMDTKREVMTEEILRQAWQDKKQTAIPKVTGPEMDFYFIDNLKELKKGSFGIAEPPADRPAKGMPGLCLVPGAVFDEAGYRIGYGKGYYDRFFRQQDGFIKAGLAYEEQIVKQIPYDAYDIPMDMIVTEERIILCRRT